MYYLYLIIFFIILLIIFKCYIKIKYKFWSRQPVFHYYDILLWIFPKGIINKTFPITNKYCNFINIETKDFIDCDDNLLNEIVNFIKTYYITHNSCCFAPSIDNFSSYFIGSNNKTFISMYYKPKIISDSNNSFINDKELLGLMTTRPINITLKNTETFLAYYVDNLCIHNSYRKQNIAPEIIQTTHYTQRHQNKDSYVSLFKREGILTGIVSLTKYNTYQFHISSIKKPHTIYQGAQIIEITKLNTQLLVDFINKQKNLFDCIILPEINTIINLINNNTYIIYCILDNNEFKAVYFFKDSQMTYNFNSARENKYDKSKDSKDSKEQINKNVKSIDCFASINLFNDYEIFFNCFNLVLNKCNKNNNYTLITIENISSNNIIINNLFILKIIPRIVSPTAYFYYNYAKKPILPENALIIC